MIAAINGRKQRGDTTSAAHVVFVDLFASLCTFIAEAGYHLGRVAQTPKISKRWWKCSALKNSHLITKLVFFFSDYEERRNGISLVPNVSSKSASPFERSGDVV